MRRSKWMQIAMMVHVRCCCAAGYASCTGLSIFLVNACRCGALGLGFGAVQGCFLAINSGQELDHESRPRGPGTRTGQRLWVMCVGFRVENSRPDSCASTRCRSLTVGAGAVVLVNVFGVLPVRLSPSILRHRAVGIPATVAGEQDRARLQHTHRPALPLPGCSGLPGCPVVPVSVTCALVSP